MLWLGAVLLTHKSIGTEVGFWAFYYCGFAASGSLMLLGSTPLGFVEIIFTVFELWVPLYWPASARGRVEAIDSKP